MIPVLLTVTAIIAYFCGSVSTVNVLSNVYFKCDLKKEFPLDNHGITMFLRRFGFWKGALIVLAEVLKALLPMLIGGLLMLIAGHFDIGFAFAMFCVILGTVFPVIYRFQGSTSFFAFAIGIFVLSTSTAILALIIFAAVYWFTRYVSLSKLAALATACVIMLLSADSLIVRNMVLLSSLVVVIENRAAILRLIGKKEEKFIYKRDLSYMFDDE